MNHQLEEFALRLKQCMRAKGYTQSMLAEKAFGFRDGGARLGYIPSKRDQINAYVRARRMPNEANLQAIAKALDVTVDQLIGVTAVSTIEERYEQLQQAARRLLIALEKEASATLTLQTAQENYSDPTPDRQHSVRAMLEASQATAALRKLVDPVGEGGTG